MRHRRARVLVLTAGLALCTSACRLDVALSTTVAADGSGRFALRFTADKELADLARNTGEDPLTSICDVATELGRSGWSVNRSTPGGGLVLTLERAFSGPADLERALGDIRRCLATGSGSPGGFFSLATERSSSFFRTSTSVRGRVDLSAAGLFAGTPGNDALKRRLQGFIAGGGAEFFGFAIGAALPGRISSAKGDPREVKGPTVTWSPRLGSKLQFEASASAFKPAGVAVVGVPVVVVLIVTAAALARRRARRRNAVAGSTA